MPPSRPLTSWQIVLQSQVIHPDWDARTHLNYLQWEAGKNIDHIGPSIGLSPQQCVQKWLDENNAWPGGPAARAGMGS
jgi:hypothetical protein